MSYNNQLSSLKSEESILTASVRAMRVAKENLLTGWR